LVRNLGLFHRSTNLLLPGENGIDSDEVSAVVLAMIRANVVLPVPGEDY